MVLILVICLIIVITPLEKWDVSNGINFSFIFCECYSLKDITPLKNWNVSNGNDFRLMLGGCSHLIDTTPLKNWNLDENTFKRIFK